MFIPASGDGQGMGDVSSWSSGNKAVNSNYWKHTAQEDLIRDAVVSRLIRDSVVHNDLTALASSNSTNTTAAANVDRKS